MAVQPLMINNAWCPGQGGPFVAVNPDGGIWNGDMARACSGTSSDADRAS